MFRILICFILLLTCCEAPQQPPRLWRPPPNADTLPPVVPPLVRLDVPAEAEEDSRLTVVLHGYGSNEKDLIPVARRLGLKGRIIALRAPEVAGKGFAWFPINFEPGGTRYASDAADKVLVRLAAELETLQHEHEGELIVVGFSQGAMLTMMLAAEHPKAFDRGVALSGALPRQVLRAGGEQPRLFTSHGTADTVIAIDRAREANRWLLDAGMTPQYVEVPELGHAINDDVVRAARDFLELEFPTIGPLMNTRPPPRAGH